MNAFRRNSLLMILLPFALAACSGAAVTQQSQSVPIATSQPSQIVVYPFAVDPSEVTLNQSIVQRAYRDASGANQNTEQLSLAHDTANNLCHKLAEDLAAKGYQTVCLQRGVPATGDNFLVVDGDFTDISEGNRLRRLVIGFGAGASTLDTGVQVYQKTGEGSRQILDLTTHADSGKMPGAGIMGPAGIAAGGGTAAVLGANAAMGGAKTATSSTGYLVDKTSDQIVKALSKYFQQQGWRS